MGKFPKDALRSRVVAALEAIGFQIVRKREQIAMVRENAETWMVTRRVETMPSRLRPPGTTLVPSQRVKSTRCRLTQDMYGRTLFASITERFA